MKTYSLFELNEYIRRVLSLNMPEAIWVRCEIAQVGNSKGHFYIDIIEKETASDELIANAKAVLWKGDYRRLRRKLGKAVDELLQEGLEVLLLLKVDFHERYGFKLLIEDVDPSYTVGKLSQQRKQTLEQLSKLNLLDKNASLDLPIVLQKIAIISSTTAAGYADFTKQLGENIYQYQFDLRLFPAAMQGVFAAKEIVSQLQKIQQHATQYHCVAILRGGGSKIDLMAFDDLEISKAVASFPIPVLTGIGHDIDETVLDVVAHRALKTPTALAEFIIQQNVLFESQLLETAQFFQDHNAQKIHSEALQLEQIEQIIKLQSENRLKDAERLLDYIAKEVPQVIKVQLSRANLELNSLEKITHLLSPAQTFRRGFSLTQHQGKIIKDLKKIKEGDIITTHFSDGSLESQVTKKKS